MADGWMAFIFFSLEGPAPASTDVVEVFFLECCTSVVDTMLQLVEGVFLLKRFDII